MNRAVRNLYCIVSYSCSIENLLKVDISYKILEFGSEKIIFDKMTAVRT